MSYDLAILGDPENNIPTLTIDNTAVDGLYKLIQRVMILLLTDASAENNPGGVGTDIPELYRGGNVPPPEVVANVFAASLVQIKQTLIANIQPDTPADEVPENLTATVVSNDLPDTVTVEVVVTSQAGNSATVNVPISNITTGE